MASNEKPIEATSKPKKKCRTCLAQHNWMSSIFEQEYGSDAPYSAMIARVVGVKVSEGDGLPYHICAACKQSITVAYQFRLQARKAYQELQSQLSDPTNGVDPIPQGVIEIKKQSYDHQTLEDGDHDKEELETADKAFFQEVSVNTIKIEFQQKHSVKFEPNRVSEDDYESTVSCNDNDDNIDEDSQEVSQQYCNICGETFSTELLLSRHLLTCLKVEVELKQNYCPVCGQSFESAPALVRHARAAHRGLAVRPHKSPPKKVAKSSAPRVLFMKKLSIKKTMTPIQEGAPFVQDASKDPSCGICGIRSKSEQDLVAHYKHHRGAAMLRCTLCEMKFLEGIYLERHYITHHIDVDINTLTKGIGANNILISEVIASRSAEGNGENEDLNISVCPLCGVLMLSSSELVKHNQQQHPKYKHRCGFCAKMYPERKMLVYHQKFCAHRTPQVQCDVCKQWLQRDHLSTHIACKHGKKTAAGIACNICQTVCETLKQLAVHKNKMHKSSLERGFKCDICDKIIADKYYLKQHLKTHEPDRPPAPRSFLCLYCGHGATTSGNLAVHTRRHHTHEKPFKCTQCEMAFVKSSCLKQHMKKHTGERPYKCEVCGVGFTKKCTVQRHMRTHTGERPYKCTYCGRAFTQSQDMRAHMLRHTGRSPYTCHCGENFLKARDLRQHNEETHEKQPGAAHDPHLAMIMDQMQTARLLTLHNTYQALGVQNNV